MIFTTSFLPIDNLSLLMLILIAVLFPMVFLFSLSYIKRNLGRFYFVLAITLASMVGCVLARDFLSLYVFLEIMTVGIYFLIIDNTKKESFRAGFKYILMMFAGGLFILAAALMLYNLTGTFSMAEIAGVARTLPKTSVQLIMTLFIIGCLFEIGAVPFHIWLPEAHPIAPSPISALLSGVVIKIGAYGIIRMLFTLGLAMPGLVLIGATSMLFGVVLALRQTNIKRLLAYSSISQMGYVLLGIGIGTGVGIGGGIFHILNHATFKMLLFLCMGAVIYAAGERDIRKLGGLAKRMPITVATFGIGALAISGIPPFNGFASKALIASAISGNLLLKSVLLITAAGTFAVFFRLFLHVFAGEVPPAVKKTRKVPLLMCVPMVILAGICLVVGLVPNLILGKLISPVIAVSLTYKFWSLKLLLETFIIMSLGAGIYIVGMKTGLLGVGAAVQERKGSLLFSFLSLNKIVNLGAALIEVMALLIRKVFTRSLSAYLLWIFMALAGLLLYFFAKTSGLI
ncbi:complex I subunit 5 family protein [Candidatus Margulisiibacteriota bacterium]